MMWLGEFVGFARTYRFVNRAVEPGDTPRPDSIEILKKQAREVARFEMERTLVDETLK